MKTTGISRPIDQLGRVVIPIEIRRNLELNTGDEMEFYIDGADVTLRRYSPKCIFCGEKATKMHKGKRICPSCLEVLRDAK